jgi:hypothetical protein
MPFHHAKGCLLQFQSKKIIISLDFYHLFI